MADLSLKDKQGLALIAAMLVALGGVALFTLQKSGGPKPGTDNCVRPLAAKTVILIDRSDSITEQAADEIVKRVLSFVTDKVEVNEQVSLFEISDRSDQSLKPLFSACKPPATGNRLYENQRLIEKKFEGGFLAPLKAALAEPVPVSSVSPLSEVMTDLSLSDFLRADRAKLVIFSDLLQNSRNTSLYRCTDAGTAIQEFRARRAGAKERPEFRNVTITLNIVPREGLGEGVVKCRDGFWAWFFGDNEGPKALLDSQYLPGGAARK